jgi:two-component system OmpR family response regulator
LRLLSDLTGSPDVLAKPASATACRLLLVEDEAVIAEPVRRGLEEEGYVVTVEGDGQRGLAEALGGEYDAVIVDWRLPRLDGRALVTRLRAGGVDAPVLMLTALGEVEYRIAGLDAGADDYLTKPFSFEELLARLRSLLRRARTTTDAAPGLQPLHLRLGRLHLDAARRRVRVEGAEDGDLGLRDKEYRLLEVLLRHGGEVVSRTRIAERVWGSPFDVTDNAIDITASGLRQRLGEAGWTGVRFETVRGVGYRLSAEPAAETDGEEEA